MPAVPEFIARRVYVTGSLKDLTGGFEFRLSNPFTALTVTRIGLSLAEKAIPANQISLKFDSADEIKGEGISAENPLIFPVNQPATVRVSGVQAGGQPVRIVVDTIEAGTIGFSIQEGGGKAAKTAEWKPRPGILDFFKGPQRAILRLDAEKTLGEIDPRIYGHFIEHLERCIYSGIWTENGENLREDVLRLIQPLKPSVIRYPGGNFASGYHWEDGIGPKAFRPARFDPAWKAEESNQVGTDEFMELCRRTGAEPYICVNDASGTPEEAARWVAYCNEDASGVQGQRRAANGHPEPYHVRLWGIGNEVWGRWQVGHTDAAGYVERLRKFIDAMRAVDPNIQIVAVGDTLASDDNYPKKLWNETVLREAGGTIDYLSFHLYQPGQEGWQDPSEPKELYHTVCAAPHSAEKDIERLAEMIQQAAPGRKIKVALDEWNLWLAPPANSKSMHAVRYTMRDALYTAGMLNVFLRQSQHLGLANLAQLVNVLPLIVTDERQSYATAIYQPFVMFGHMERMALDAEVTSPTFKSQPLGNIEAMERVPYIDVSATCSHDVRKVVLGIINRHPTCRVDLSVRLRGFSRIRPTKGWLLNHRNPLAENSFTAPDEVKVKEVDLHPIPRRSRFTLDLPPCSVSVITLEE